MNWVDLYIKHQAERVTRVLGFLIILGILAFAASAALGGTNVYL